MPEREDAVAKDQSRGCNHENPAEGTDDYGGLAVLILDGREE